MQLGYLKNMQRYLLNPAQILARIEERLRNIQIGNQLTFARIEAENQRIEFLTKGLEVSVGNNLDKVKTTLYGLGKMLLTNHYHEILKRGFALIKNSRGEAMLSISEVKKEKEIVIKMSDGESEFQRTSLQPSLFN